MSATLSRRTFVKLMGGAGAGLLLGFRLEPARAAESAGATGDWSPNAFLRIAETGEVTILTPKSEMGQGVFTALPLIVAEELDADWERVRIEQSPSRAPYATATGGSDSVRSTWQPLRQAGAAARALLVAAAAAEWGVPASECTTEPGVVVHAASGRRQSYGSLATKAAALPLPDPATLPLKSPESFRLLGKPTLRRDLAAKGDGSAVFGLDVKVPGMLYASVARCPVYDGRVARVDDSQARAVRGVRQVVTLEPDREAGLPGRVAVIAESTWAAMKGRRALVVEWDEGAQADFSSAALMAAARKALDGPAEVMTTAGDAAAARGRAARVIEATYEEPFLAHATMEPMNCTARVTGTSAEVWVPSQFGGAMQSRVAKLLGLPPDNVTVHVTFLGGGFGRRAYGDFVVDAVQLAKAAGAPVKVVWSREEDVQHDLYRPASVQRLRAGLDGSGRPISWENRAAGPSTTGYWNANAKHPWMSEAPDNIEYEIPDRLLDYAYVPAPVPVGAWRAVRHTQNVFAIESFMDELAQAAGADPIEYRLALLKEPRARQVLETVRQRSGWGPRLPRGRGRGVAFMNYAGTYVAHVAEVTVSGKDIRVDRVACAFDCGQMINPDTVRAQIESAMVWGVSAALWGEITVERGRTVQSNFHDYRVARMRETPLIDVALVVNHETPTGVGEPAVPGVAPAVANAVFAATGRRVRRLPLAAARGAAET